MSISFKNCNKCALKLDNNYNKKYNYHVRAVKFKAADCDDEVVNRCKKYSPNKSSTFIYSPLLAVYSSPR